MAFIQGNAPPERGTFFYSSWSIWKSRETSYFGKGLKRPVRCFYVSYGCEKVKKKKKRKKQKTFWSVIYSDFKDSPFTEIKKKQISLIDK